ncbi:MAG: hypothetical protein NZ561_13525, partial [Phycisphaerae bacterium]|nr:hypothetical protein [Phycisphaerae bacterium]MDW8261981.1 hypothetical protein [Phycisphaerales bacterium]
MSRRTPNGLQILLDQVTTMGREGGQFIALYRRLSLPIALRSWRSFHRGSPWAFRSNSGAVYDPGKAEGCPGRL